MKIAFISDIHANLPALEAVLNHLRDCQPGNIYCPGDLVNFAGWNEEVFELIRSRDITRLQENHDQGIGYQKKRFPFSARTKAQKEFGRQSIKNVEDSLSDESRMYLCNPPFLIKLELAFPECLSRTVLHKMLLPCQSFLLGFQTSSLHLACRLTLTVYCKLTYSF